MFKNILLTTISFLTFLSYPLLGMDSISQKSTPALLLKDTHLIDDSLDGLVLQGIKHISNEGEQFKAKAGSGQQAYDVAYTLTNPLNRLHAIRQPQSIKYFCRELIAYFKGSLDVSEGLEQASSFWKTLADEDNKIASNYGYYIFHQKASESKNMTQYEWVIASLMKNLDSRKAFININQPCHKILTSVAEISGACSRAG